MVLINLPDNQLILTNSMQQQEVQFIDLGQMEYQQAWDYQERLLQENIRRKKIYKDAQTVVSGNSVNENKFYRNEAISEPVLPQTQHYLLFVEHPPVYTLGKSGKEEHVLINEEKRIEKGITYIKTNRGGDITFHGPEQLVGYPILDLEYFYTDIGKYLRNLEEVLILTLKEYGLQGERSAGETGVWLDALVLGEERKICAIGVRCSRWITMHGFAFNINTDLSYFDDIIPCGIRNKKVTTLEKELGRKIPMEEVKGIVKSNFEKVFAARLIGA